MPMPKQSALDSNESLYVDEEETIMTKPRIIVTGATGKTGSVVVTELLKAGYPVRAMVRREDDRSVRLKAQGRGSRTDTESKPIVKNIRHFHALN